MAHIWNSTLGFLALHEEIQEEMYKEVQSVAPDGVPIVRPLKSSCPVLASSQDMCRRSPWHINSTKSSHVSSKLAGSSVRPQTSFYFIFKPDTKEEFLIAPGFVLVRDTTDFVLLPHYYCCGVASHVGVSPKVRVAVDIVGLRTFTAPKIRLFFFLYIIFT